MTDLVLATNNQGKVKEMQSILQDWGFNVLPQSQFTTTEAVEDGLSFVENAIIKARHACKLTNLPAIADDSGLQVKALNDAPGIYSSRFAGEQASDEQNNQKLLSALHNKHDRQARFVCVIVFLRHEFDPTPIISQGTWNGEIAQQASGNNGFGYDPLFYIPELGCHSAELSPEQKKQFSHRAKALADFQTQLKSKQVFL